MPWRRHVQDESSQPCEGSQQPPLAASGVQPQPEESQEASLEPAHGKRWGRPLPCQKGSVEPLTGGDVVGKSSTSASRSDCSDREDSSDKCSSRSRSSSPTPPFQPFNLARAGGSVPFADPRAIEDRSLFTGRRNDDDRDMTPNAAQPGKRHPLREEGLAFGNRHHGSGAESGATSSSTKNTGVSTSHLRNLRRSRKRAEQRGLTEDGQQPSGSGCVVLVREDCRLHDNPALHHAAQHFEWVIPLYVHDDADPSPWPVRGAGLWWKHESLHYFSDSLRALGSRLIYRRGYYVEQVVDVLLESGAKALLFNRQLEPWHHDRDLNMEKVVGEDLKLAVHSFKASVMIFEPWEAAPRGSKRERRRLEGPVPTVSRKLQAPPAWPTSLQLDALGYGRTGGRSIPRSFSQFNPKRQMALESGIANPAQDDWAFEMRSFWKMGEQAAMERLEEFLVEAAWGCYFPPGLHPRDTAGGRFRADKKWTAIISPYIRFGDLSPRYVYHRCRQVLPHELRKLFLKRVVWRDKAYAQLYEWPESHTVSIRPQYEHEKWSGTRSQLFHWQRGMTGFPLVDAAMRQLWKVGWMCNHLRHVTAQFLIEHLDLSWKDGFAWYDYTLVDTDVAINAMMWQMGGHSGVGAWNFVMHPVYAGKKVDPEGAYVRRWLPELAHLPVEYIHCPWEAPAGTRLAANVLINGTYWQRVVEDLLKARLTHQRNVIEVRKRFPEQTNKDGFDLLRLFDGRVVQMSVRDDIRENDENKITLMMTADDPRSALRRNLGFAKGVHGSIIYDETKRFEAMYDVGPSF